MTDQPIAHSELSEQLDSLSNALDSKITTVSGMLHRSEQLCDVVQQSELSVTQIHQEIMNALSAIGGVEKLGALPPLEQVQPQGSISDARLEAIEAQVNQLQEVLPRLAKDIKVYARIAQHMEQCAAEVTQLYGEIKSLNIQPAPPSESSPEHLMQINSAIQALTDSQSALAEQLAHTQSSPGVSTQDLSELEERLRQWVLQEIPRSESGTSASPETQGEIEALQQEWQTGAAILQQMQVQIESLQAKVEGSPSSSPTIEAMRAEMSALLAQAKTEQEGSLRDQRKQLGDVSDKARLAPLAFGGTILALVLGIIGIAR